METEAMGWIISGVATIILLFALQTNSFYLLATFILFIIIGFHLVHTLPHLEKFQEDIKKLGGKHGKN